MTVIEKEIKERNKRHVENTKNRYIDGKMSGSVYADIDNGKQDKPRQRRCRHHTRPAKAAQTTATANIQPQILTPEQMERRQLVTRWQAQDTTKYQYQSGQGRVGGHAVKATEAVDPQLRIGTLNVNGLDDTKLELILQFVQGETIDVLFLIDTRIEKKAGKYMGKKIKTLHYILQLHTGWAK
jgi:hypothetical protein